MISASATLAVSLVFNELCTAVKYGALSLDAERASIDGPLNDAGDRMTLVWRETVGPPVTPPTTRSFGSQVTEVTIPESEVQMDYRWQGLNCSLVIKMETLYGAARRHQRPGEALSKAPRTNDEDFVMLGEDANGNFPRL